MNPLLAQHVIVADGSPSGLNLVIGLVALIFAPVLLSFPLLLLWKSARMRHEERMRRMELGFPLDATKSRWPIALYGAAVGAGVPVAAFSVTLMASQSLPPSPDSLLIWIVPGVVSVAAILGTTIVVGVAFTRPDPSAAARDATAKPVPGPDAFEFAGGHPRI